MSATASPFAIAANVSRAVGSSSESLLATASTGSPRRMRLTGVSSFFPVSVRGIEGTARIMSGTWRGDSCERKLWAMLLRSSSSSA